MEQVFELVYHEKGKSTLLQETIIAENQGHAFKISEESRGDNKVERHLISVSVADPIAVIKKLQLIISKQL